ncbi:hypothetical protein IW261DRAFT_1012034 [Armillaria novae-zelandiae]|uniref:C2H2-type domain-containing protein n=1 Tax=Armillaria novae-zelandiae TaxID=153914 RepID=A0AA39NNF3_9AGAR|nr:hypothetical protein IW261DRAFT_1012034 [Armillaria novae-zelandiae]
MTFSLPSIHEMFPEHMLRSQPDWRRDPPTVIHSPPPPPPPRRDTRCSLNVLRSDPSSASLASSTSLPYPPPPRYKTSSLSSEEDDETLAKEDKKHICTVCHKRFNRPSSLRIHVNTHTGATPFQCPFPGCGRGFNVNSNMRRHYRNHTNPGAAGTGPKYPSSWRVCRPYQKLRINESEYVWHPSSSSSASSDNDDEETRREVYRASEYEEKYGERDFDRRRMSDMRDEHGARRLYPRMR